MIKEAYFAGGCFWCVTPIYKIYGVQKVISGYSGGDEPDPTYEEVKAQQTGHRETIMLTYDPERVSYEKLLDIYLANVDPFDAEGQFIDKGFSYTLAIFYTEEEERKQALAKLKALEEKSGKPVQIALLPFKSFYPAEEYHQDYYIKNPTAYSREMAESGRRGQIRELTQEDLPKVFPLFRTIFSAAPWNDDWSDDAQLTEYLKDQTEVRGALPFGLFEGEELIGFSLGHIKHWCAGTEYCIEEYGVSPDHQGRGYGKAFFSMIQRELKLRGVRTIYLLTSREVHAYQFYKRLGFTEQPELTSLYLNF